MNKHLITILTTARTGSNYFCEYIEKSFEDINVNYELFNTGVCCLNHKLKKPISALYDISFQNLHIKIKDNPYQLIDTIAHNITENNILFKLFLDHLSQNETENILIKSKMVIILKRNFVDMFISKQKAVLLNKYSQINTTDIKIIFDFKEYENIKAYYEKLFVVYDIFLKKNNIPFVVINYEEFHTLSLKEQQLFMKNIWDTYIPENAINIIKNATPITFFKQDISNDYKDKISNYTEFLEYFEKSNRS